jgi:hypothetical protein
MKYGRGLPWRELAALGSIGATFVAACAGTDIPEVTNETREDLIAAYTRSGAGAGGQSGSGGAAGRSNGGAAGSGGAAGAASGGSAGAAGAGGSAGNGGAAGAGGAAGSGGAAGAGGGGEVCNGFAVLQASCNDTNCHGAGSNLGNFAESEEAARSFIGEEGAVCGGQGALFDPENPEDSVVVLKLSDEAPCGQPMPLNRDPLEQADIDCLVEWIGSLEP